MMRLNAPIPALLALAALSLSSANSLAKQTHHPSAHKKTAAATAEKHPTKRKPAAKPAHAAHSSKHHTAPTADPPVTARVHAQASSRRRLRHAVSAPAPGAMQPVQTAPAPQKATSEDFLKAAAPTQVETQAAVTIHGTSRPEELNETRQAPTVSARKPASASKPVSVAKPVPVISVVRP